MGRWSGPSHATGWIIVVCWAVFLLVWIAMAPRAKRAAEVGTGRVRTIWTIITVAAVVVWHQFSQRGALGGGGQLWSYSMLAATALYTGSVPWLIVLVGAFCFVLAESRLDEGLMTRQFPNEYPAYRARVKRLVPLVF